VAFLTPVTPLGTVHVSWTPVHVFVWLRGCNACGCVVEMSPIGCVVRLCGVVAFKGRQGRAIPRDVTCFACTPLALLGFVPSLSELCAGHTPFGVT
jgi:hypothetical protein